MSGRGYALLCPTCARNWGVRDALCADGPCDVCEAYDARQFKVDYVERDWALVTRPNPLCDVCKKAEADTFDSDPYSGEIDGCYRPEWQCSECEHNSAMDV
jgi:hypothetical protein